MAILEKIPRFSQIALVPAFFKGEHQGWPLAAAWWKLEGGLYAEAFEMSRGK